MHEREPSVLVVEDKPTLADVYAHWLREHYRVEIAYSGREALDAVGDVDVVLLDRDLPDVHGDEVLERIRARDDACRVAMVTGVEPDFDIVDMGFDEYVVKPASRADLDAVVEDLLTRRTYDERLRRYYAAAAKVAALQATKADAELERSTEYRRLLERLDTAAGAADETFAEIDSTRTAFREATRQPETDTPAHSP